MPEISSDRIEPTFVDTILSLAQSEDKEAQKAAVATRLKTAISQIVEVRLRKHSIGARQRIIKVQLRFKVRIGEPLAPEPNFQPNYPTVSTSAENVLIVGCGPAGRIDQILPEWIISRLRRGLDIFGMQMRGYITKECNLIDFESRNSSPIRIPRDKYTFQHPEIRGLYPCGEGAGFAGGIVSATLDGMRCAEAAAKSKGNTDQDLRAPEPTAITPLQVKPQLSP